MNKKTIQAIVILLVIVLIGVVFVIKVSSKGNLATAQETIDGNANAAQSNRTELEIEGFTPEMIQKNEKPLIIVMGESWCQPCLRMLPDLRELNKTVSDVEIRYMDLEKNEEAFSYFPIRVTPTIAIFMPEGKPFTPPEDSTINYIIYTYRDTGEHALTIHEGALTRDQLETMIEDVRNAG
ncbi:MAG: thioredoxin family protein [Spirochaetes bacterium]|uniref:Thioredoxin family protein n=1 Tax=Candidatus Ornithospirochaeta stercoripullorum TaxID=2840899 RepID=A0A9D9H6W5_9SPIO|nr:thioredoxin family protein [Candidatus Ornithospirochaeta stercoripullorum]